MESEAVGSNRLPIEDRDREGHHSGGVKTIPCPLDVDESRSSEEVAVLPTKVSVWQDGEAAMVDTTPKLPLALDPPEVISGACRYAFRKRKSNVSYVYKYGKAKPQRGKASTATEKDEKGSIENSIITKCLEIPTLDSLAMAFKAVTIGEVGCDTSKTRTQKKVGKKSSQNTAEAASSGRKKVTFTWQPHTEPVPEDPATVSSTIQPRGILRKLVIEERLPLSSSSVASSSGVPDNAGKPARRGQKRTIKWFQDTIDEAIRGKRTCFNHLAGADTEALHASEPLPEAEWDNTKISARPLFDSTKTFRMSIGKPTVFKAIENTTYQASNAKKATDRLNFQGYLAEEKRQKRKRPLKESHQGSGISSAMLCSRDFLSKSAAGNISAIFAAMGVGDERTESSHESFGDEE